jgi:hypothetical protein
MPRVHGAPRSQPIPLGRFTKTLPAGHPGSFGASHAVLTLGSRIIR